MLTLVFDIGKTNKKCLLFDQNLHVVEEESVRMSETEDPDGFPCEDLTQLTEWLLHTFSEKQKQYKAEISALNFSTYGASFVMLGKTGVPVAPLYNYLKAFPEALYQQFWGQYGPAEDFCCETASPALGMLNSGLQLYWLKYARPVVFQQIGHALHLPTYAAYLFHGQKLSEPTSIGCHTALWHFRNHTYHDWVEKEGILPLLSPIVPSSFQIQASLNGYSVAVGAGLHDSSAALVPYLLGFQEPFALISTGTWSITLNPFDQSAPTHALLAEDGLNFLSYLGTPVKATRLFLGNEHDKQSRKLICHFHKPENAIDQVQPNAEMFESLKPQITRLLPSRIDNTKPLLPQFDPSEYASFEEAYHVLIGALAALQVHSVNLAIGDQMPRQVLLSGGFSKNKLFLEVLASNLSAPLCISEMSHASALGAALLMRDNWSESVMHQLRTKYAVSVDDRFRLNGAV